MSDLTGSMFAGDAAKWHPSSDLFGYLPFAKRLASSIVGIKSTHGVVLAITGEWGAGKSTLLNFVIHELSNAQVAPYPAVIEFNPWWFTSREDLAPQIIRALHDKTSDFGGSSKLRFALAKYADAIGAAANAAGGPLAKIASDTVLTTISSNADTVPELKKQVAKRLAGAGQKFVFFVDDIDRLSPQEVADLIRSIKALGDFPNVVYVLAFDRSVVAKALSVSLSTDGDAYLEKVVQASFAIPAIDRLTLRKWLFDSLDRVIASHPGGDFDNSYWAQIYFDGLEDLIKTPRDVVRLANTISVTYPAVAGEVNVVDFIALEVLRLYAPAAYGVVRANKDRFAGKGSSDAGDIEVERQFHDAWMKDVPDADAVKKTLGHIFPRFSKACTSGFHMQSGPGNWRKHLRVCSVETFPIYFQLGVPTEVAARSLINDLLQAARRSADEAAAVLERASSVSNVAGIPQSRDLIDRLCDADEAIPVDAIPGLLAAIFKVGDAVIAADNAGYSGFVGVTGRRRLSWLVTRLVNDAPEVQRPHLVASAFANGAAIAAMTETLDNIQRTVERNGATSNEYNAFAEFGGVDVLELREILVKKFSGTDVNDALRVPDLDFVLHRLGSWGEANVVRAKILPVLASAKTVSMILEKLVHYSRSQRGNDPLVHKRASLNPRLLDRFVDPDWLDPFVVAASEREGLSAGQREAIDAYIWSRSRLKEGRPLDDFWDDDE